MLVKRMAKLVVGNGACRYAGKSHDNPMQQRQLRLVMMFAGGTSGR